MISVKETQKRAENKKMFNYLVRELQVNNNVLAVIARGNTALQEIESRIKVYQRSLSADEEVVPESFFIEAKDPSNNVLFLKGSLNSAIHALSAVSVISKKTRGQIEELLYNQKIEYILNIINADDKARSYLNNANSV